ncbi:MAG: carboxypeptidase-like regulatory domain-containing protein [Saprospiraceae bacterium]
MPLTGATVAVLSLNPIIGAVTDIDGQFMIPAIPVGRHQVSVSYLGYEPLLLSGIILSSGKELVLELEMVESTTQLAEITVSAEDNRSEALNEFASVSARSFSVEETSRYASSLFDPARMAQNFAGVSVGSGDDLFNEIVVRGNSPRGVLWRMEGIEIPNPNHFSGAGSSGGAISMLSSTTLSNSDFYTGAFPAEFGNALSGVFDLKLRNGNNQKQEYSAMIGLLGIELGAEGPFSANGKSSYVINYRYSTLKALETLGLSPVEDILPKYQDLSFKFNFPTAQYGTFALFGLGGNNASSFDPDSDPQNWEGEDDKWGFLEEQQLGIIGLSHQILTSDRSYLRTVISGSINESNSHYYYLDSLRNYQAHDDATDLVSDQSLRLSSTYSHKINRRSTIRTGAIISALKFKFQYDEDNGENLERFFDNSGNTQFLQAFLQWKYRWKDNWTFFSGVHYSHFMLNGKKSIEPRTSIQYQASPKTKWSASLGLHSKMEHLAIYLFDGSFPNGDRHQPAKYLDLTKAMHAVIGYNHILGKDLRLNIEAYYQHLYDVPIESDPNSTGSLINASNIWDVIRAEDAVSRGTGRNVGIDLTLEKPFANDYYFLITGSLYDSKFKNLNDQWYNTTYNGNYQMSLLGGKEFRVGQKNLLAINAKMIFSGGNRFTPLDEAASKALDEAVYFEDRPFAERTGNYQRFDLGFSYKINTQKNTHSIMIDIQNVFNRENLFGQFYNQDSNQIEKYYQTGLFPTLNYRIEF